MTTTLTTPAGVKVRSASQRRYVAVRERVDRTGNEPPQATIVRRSDDRAKIVKFARGEFLQTIHHRYKVFVFDTTTGEILA